MLHGERNTSRLLEESLNVYEDGASGERKRSFVYSWNEILFVLSVHYFILSTY